MKEPAEEHSLYKIGYWEIFSKNFLVGFARGIGGIVVQLIFLAFMYFSFISFILPKLQPILNTMLSAQESLIRLQNPGTMFGIDINTPKQTR